MSNLCRLQGNLLDHFILTIPLTSSNSGFRYLKPFSVGTIRASGWTLKELIPDIIVEIYYYVQNQ